MTLRLPRSGNAGFSLVELMVVAALMGFIMMAVMSLYLPVQRSTLVQTRVTDVQDNLRLAMDRLTKDLLTAGFLIPDPVASPPIINFGAQGFTIQTVMVGDGFARVVSAENDGGVKVTLSDPQMVSAFRANITPELASKVRIFDPVAATELVPGVYNVKSSDPVAGTLTIEGGTALVAGTSPNNVRADAVVVRTVFEGNPATPPPALQTVRYSFNSAEGTLNRIVNGSTQILARELSNVVFTYNDPTDISDDSPVQRVNIELVGKTKAVKEGDAIGGAKTRTLISTVKLRNA